MSSNLLTPSFSPGVMSLLPMIYVGWSDSVLSPSEMDLISQKIDELPYLTIPDRQYIRKVMNPQSLPSKETFKHWLNEIKKGAEDIPAAEKTTLLDLGLAIAMSNVGHEDHYRWNSPKTKEALLDIEKALGVDDYVSRSMLYRMGSVPSYSEQDGLLAKKIQTALDQPYSELMKKVRRLLRDPAFQMENTGDINTYRSEVLQKIGLLADQGLGSYAFPKAYGGKDKRGDHIAIFETLAYGDLSLTVKFGVQFGLFGGSLYALGTKPHHDRYLRDMLEGRLLGCFAMTETGHGSNVKDLETTITFDSVSGAFIVHSPSNTSGKEFIGNSLHCKMAIVFGQLIVEEENHGVHAILVPVRDEVDDLLPGVRIVDSGIKMGLNGVDNGRIWFDNVVVPRDNLLNKFGSVNEKGIYSSSIENPSKRFFTMLGTLVLGRVSVGLASVSASKKSLFIAIKYALRRRQFRGNHGKIETLLMDYPSHSEKLVPLLAKTYALHFSLRSLEDMMVEAKNDNQREIETLAAGLKAQASWHCTQTIQVCREACGGKGYLSENQLPNLKADTDIFSTFEGDNTVLMQLVAKSLLTEFRQSFSDDRILAVIRFILKKVQFKMKESHFIHKRNTDFNHLTSETFLLNAVFYRYEKMLYSLSERMRKFLQRGIDPHSAFLKTQVHLIELAHAFVDHLIADSFHRKLASTPDKGANELLNLLFQLSTLNTIYTNRGWYLENGYIDSQKSKAIRRTRTKLIEKCRPSLDTLVQAFGIPDELVGAPIAFKDHS